MEDLQNTRVLVTGADGFIGSHLTEELVLRGAQVTALCQYNSFGKMGWLQNLFATPPKNLEIVLGDIRDSGFIAELICDKDFVFHLAALIGIPYSYSAPRSYAEVNITGTMNVLEACKQHKNTRLIHTSTSEVYGTAITTPIDETHPLQAQSPYSASKIAADNMVVAYHNTFEINTAILRPFNTFGPRQSERAVIPTIIRQLLDDKCSSVWLGSLSPSRDFNYVSNTVDAFIKIALCEDIRNGEVYNAGSGKSITIGELCQLLKSICKIDKPIETERSRQRPAKSEVLELKANSSKLQKATTWRPTVSLENGLEKTVEWWHSQFQKKKYNIQNGYQI